MFLDGLLPAYGFDPESSTINPFPDPTKSPYESQVKYWVNAAYEEAVYENRQDEDVREMAKAVDYLVGKQWPGARPMWKSRPVNNRIWRLFWELVATLTDVRPLFDIKALRREYDPQADILNQCTRSWWMDADADLTLALIVVYALLCTGYGKLEWNPRLRNGEGDFDLIPLGPNEVFPLKARNTLQSAQAIIYAVPQPLSWFRMKFPTRGYRVKPDAQYSRYAMPRANSSGALGIQFEFLSPAMKRVMNQSPATQDSMFPMALYREIWFDDFGYNQSNRPVYMGDPRSNWGYWVKPGERLYPRGRLICFGGNEIMHDGPNPYWHGQAPFAAMRMNIVPWKFHGLSECRPLLPLQDIINNILAGVLDMVKKAVNPQFIGPENALSPAAWNALDPSLPGAKIKYSMAAGNNAPRYEGAPNLPSFVLNVTGLIAREMDASSGIATISEAVRKKQIPSADTLEQMKQSQQTPIRLKGRNIEIFLRRLGTMNIPNIFQFYTAERRMFMLGKDGLTFEDFDWQPKSMVPAGQRPQDHIRNFVFLVQPGTLLKINQVETSMMMLKLRAMGDIDRKSMFKQLDVGVDPDIVQKNLDEENAQKLATAIKAKLAAGAVMGGGAM